MPARQLWAFFTERDVEELIAKIAAREPGLAVSQGRYLLGNPQDLLDGPEKLERREALPGERRIYLLHRKHCSEIVTHLAFYAGWGNAMDAVAVIKEVFATRKIAADQLPPASPKLLALNEAAEADRAKRVGDLFGAAFPGVTQYTTDVLFRDLWLRPGLAPRERSLALGSSCRPRHLLRRPELLRGQGRVLQVEDER